MAIVMGLDQHRGQITGEWIDTETGEVQRTRVVPADRAGVRKWLSRFRGRELEVALEATTGWRFVVEALRRVGAEELRSCAPSPCSDRCAAASSRQSPAATPAWTAQKDRAAATLPPAGSPHQTSCRRPGTNPGRGPK